MEVDIETLQALIATLPVVWQKHIATAVVLWPLLSLLLWPAKWIVAKTVTSPQARAWFDALFKLADLVALNTKGMDLHPMAQSKTKEKKK